MIGLIAVMRDWLMEAGSDCNVLDYLDIERRKF